jgi:hypothetical protein
MPTAPDGHFVTFAIDLGPNKTDSGMYVVNVDDRAARRIFSWGFTPVWRPRP